MSINQIKLKARLSLIGRYGILIAASFFFEALVILVGNVFTSTSSMTTLIASVVITLLAGILEAGLYRIYLISATGEKITAGDLFYCLSNAPDRYIVIALILLVLKTVLTLPCCALFPAWAAFYVMPFPFYAPHLLAGFPMVLRILMAIIWSVLALWIYLHFILVYLIALCDESMTAAQVIQESITLMKGQCLQFIKLQLSFIGYLFLGLCSLGIGFIWIIPYIRMSTVCFFLQMLPQEEPPETASPHEPFETDQYFETNPSDTENE